MATKKAARHFQTTVKTARKWRKRWQEKKGVGLKDLSKKPEKSPRMMKMYWQFKIKALAEKATADNKHPLLPQDGCQIFKTKL